jgi:hypothetical protein
MFGVCRLRIIVILARQREAYDEYRAAVRVIAAWMLPPCRRAFSQAIARPRPLPSERARAVSAL